MYEYCSVKHEEHANLLLYKKLLKANLITSSALVTFSAKIRTTSNQFYNILRLFDVSLYLPFIRSETMRDYYLYTWYIRVASRVAKRLKT